MVTRLPSASKSCKRGGVTLEFASAFVVLGIPLMLALAQLGRVDLAARRLQFMAQETVVAAAMAGNEDPDFRLMPVQSSVTLSASPEWRRLPGASDYSLTLRREYWIGTGSGHGENW